MFGSIPWYSAVMWFVVLGALIGLNEVTRRWKAAGLAFFVALPLVLTIFVWPHTATGSTGTWFHWVKVYSALAGCLGFMAIRYLPSLLQRHRWVLVFPPLILAINIMEAVTRDFQVGGMHEGVVDGVYMVPGVWNYLNGVAGILNAVTICGWAGIYVARTKTKDMVWPDMLWFWILPYDLWNFAYVYNCVGDHSFYAGAALLISCTIPAFWIRKGAWLQHRAHTLALWMMFTMAVPAFVTDSSFSVAASHSTTALFLVSLVSFLSNVALAVYQVITIVRTRRNPLRGTELYPELEAYRSVVRADEASAAQAAPVLAGV